MSWSIRVDGLGKRYRIGAKTTPYKTLRESLQRLATLPPARRTVDRDLIWALRGVSFELEQGQILGILGHNGAGKSTLLKILSRITEPTKGRAELRGRVGSLLEVGTGFHPELTGRENAYLSGAILGMRRAEVRAKLDEIVDFAEVDRFIDTPIKHYSTGMYLRLAFAVAAHLETEILLVDEVLAVGDAAFRDKCMGSMSQAVNSGRTVLFVSHNLAAIQQICTRALALENGRIVDDGEPSLVVENYLRSASAARSLPQTIESSHGLTIEEAGIEQAGHENPIHVDSSLPFKLRIRYRLSEALPRFLLGFEIRSETGVVLFRTYDYGGDAPTRREAGRYASEFLFEADSLKAGTYFVDLLAAVHRQGWIVRGQIRLRVTLTDVRRTDVTLPGLVSPTGHWTLNERPDQAAASDRSDESLQS